MLYKYAIIDSDHETITSIENFFKKNSDYKCVGVSDCKDKSLDIILEFLPDIVFINVDITNDNCSDAFSFVNELYQYCDELPSLIALSKNKELAFNCIKNGFVDYLQKPISNFELRKAIAKLKLKPKVSSNTLSLKNHRDTRFVDMDNILFLKADNNYTDIFMNDGSTVTAFKTLKDFESTLPENFTRIHNSYIVNQDYVSRIHFGKYKCTIKQKNISIPFSKSYKENVLVLEEILSKKSMVSLN